MADLRRSCRRRRSSSPGAVTTCAPSPRMRSTRPRGPTDRPSATRTASRSIASPTRATGSCTTGIDSSRGGMRRALRTVPADVVHLSELRHELAVLAWRAARAARHPLRRVGTRHPAAPERHEGRPQTRVRPAVRRHDAARISSAVRGDPTRGPRVPAVRRRRVEGARRAARPRCTATAEHPRSAASRCAGLCPGGALPRTDPSVERR